MDRWLRASLYRPDWSLGVGRPIQNPLLRKRRLLLKNIGWFQDDTRSYSVAQWMDLARNRIWKLKNRSFHWHLRLRPTRKSRAIRKKSLGCVRWKSLGPFLPTLGSALSIGFGLLRYESDNDNLQPLVRHQTDYLKKNRHNAWAWGHFYFILLAVGTRTSHQHARLTIKKSCISNLLSHILLNLMLLRHCFAAPCIFYYSIRTPKYKKLPYLNHRDICLNRQ